MCFRRSRNAIHRSASRDSEATMFHSFEPTPTSDWIAAVEMELGPNRAFESLVWTLEPGIDVRPFYRRNDVSHHAAPLAGEHAGWLICDEYPVFDIESSEPYIEDALNGGADTVELISRDPVSLMEHLALSRSRPGGSDLPIAIRGGNRLFRAVLETLAAGGPESSGPSAAPGDSLRGPNGPARANSIQLHLDPVRDLFERPGAELGDVESQTGGLPAPANGAEGPAPSESVAIALGSLVDWCSAATDRGVPLGALLGRISLVLPIGSNMLVEIARLRALRLLLPQVVGAFGESLAAIPHIHATSARTPGSDRPFADQLIPATVEALAAVLGGADSISLPACRLADDDVSGSQGRRLMRNVQLLLREEGRLGAVSGAVAGSWYVETLTDAIAKSAWRRFLEIEDVGGLARATAAGMIDRIGNGGETLGTPSGG